MTCLLGLVLSANNGNVFSKLYATPEYVRNRYSKVAFGARVRPQTQKCEAEQQAKNDADNKSVCTLLTLTLNGHFPRNLHAKARLKSVCMGLGKEVAHVRCSG